VSTEQQNGSQVFEGQQHGGREAWRQEEEDPRFATTPPDGQYTMHNGGHVKFEVPKVPVIFVLGKITFLQGHMYADIVNNFTPNFCFLCRSQSTERHMGQCNTCFLPVYTANY